MGGEPLKERKDKTMFMLKKTHRRIVTEHVAYHKAVTDRLKRQIEELEHLLTIAQRNDTPKDPATGRFVRKIEED